MKDLLRGTIWLVFFMGGGVLLAWLGINVYQEESTWGNGVILYMCGFLIATMLTANYCKEKGGNK